MTFHANDDHVATRHGFTAAFGLAFAQSRSGSPPSLGQDNWRTIQSYDAEWKPTVTTRPDATTVGSVSESFAYSPFAELAGYEAQFAGTPQLTVQYTGDGLGRITRRVETLIGVTHTHDCVYDLGGRLSEVKLDGVTAATYADDGERSSCCPRQDGP